MNALERYYAPISWGDPAHAVVRLAGAAIREAASRYFGGRMLDIGCGSGRKQLLLDGLISDYVGLDHPDSPHDSAHVDLVASAYDIPADDGAFDCVLSTAVMEHLEEPGRAIAEAWRVLRPGGHAIYSMPLTWHLHEEPRDFYRFTRHGLRYLFESQGFEIVELNALSGFWTTFGTELAYYLQRFARGPLVPLVRLWVAAGNLCFPRMDRGRLRDERFTWAYLVVLRRPKDGEIPRSARVGGVGEVTEVSD